MTRATLRPATSDDEDGIDAVIRAAFGAKAPHKGDRTGDLWAEVRGPC